MRIGSIELRTFANKLKGKSHSYIRSKGPFYLKRAGEFGAKTKVGVVIKMSRFQYPLYIFFIKSYLLPHPKVRH